MKKKKVKLPPREAPYTTYALSDTQIVTPWGTTIPSDSAVQQMRRWSQEHEQ